MYLSIAQIVVSILLIILIMLQESSSGLSGIMGGGSGGDGGFYHTRRGMEKFIYWGTIILAISFAVLALIDLVV